MSTDRERELVAKFKEARSRKEALKEQLLATQNELDKAEQELYELMTAEGKERTATFDGIGFVSMLRPDLYASCKKENEEALFDFLRESGRGDMVKLTVNAKSLSGFVKDAIEQGKEIPQYISYYLKPSLKFYER